MSPLDLTVVGYLRPLPSIGVDLVTLAGPTTSLREGRQALLDATAEDFALEARSYRRDEDHVPSWLRCGTESQTRIVGSLAQLVGPL